ncbi:hypothetical protein [Clostridium paraputrificum]|uniref:hypothetical protein n=1 Tax=Clostridium paraputrificum TaxID=29363 RepID=UPI0018A0748D|nr:hypothetical protein [Clostridium paraputrificum]
MVKKREKDSKREEEAREEELRKYDYYDGKEGGSILTFFGGIILFCIGAFMIFQNTTISTGFGLSRLIGFDVPTGLIIFPLLVGVVILFFNEDSIFGWFLVVVGLLIIIVGIIMGLRIHFNRITMFQGIIMFVTTAAGIGLTLKGLFGKKIN